MFLVIYELLDYILCVSVLFWANCVLNQRSCRRKMNRTEREEVVSSSVTIDSKEPFVVVHSEPNGNTGHWRKYQN